MQVGSEPCDGDGDVPGDAEVRERVSRVKSAPKIIVFRAPKISAGPKAIAPLSRMAPESEALGGVSVRGAFEEDDPGTWETQPLDAGRRSAARETGAADRMWLGVGGLCSSDEAGERVTPDPVERRDARVGSNFRRET
jgi:hypothetical protein